MQRELGVILPPEPFYGLLVNGRLLIGMNILTNAFVWIQNVHLSFQYSVMVIKKAGN